MPEQFSWDLKTGNKAIKDSSGRETDSLIFCLWFFKWLRCCDMRPKKKKTRKKKLFWEWAICRGGKQTFFTRKINLTQKVWAIEKQRTKPFIRRNVFLLSWERQSLGETIFDPCDHILPGHFHKVIVLVLLMINFSCHGFPHGNSFTVWWLTGRFIVFYHIYKCAW